MGSSPVSYWNTHARTYDLSMRLLGRPMPRMVALASEAVRGRRRVLEIGSGSGLVTVGLARAAGEVLATDYAAAMVTTTEAAVRRQGLRNVHCEQADLYALPFADASFDAIVAANVLHLVPDLPAAFAALHRVLEPGGVLILPTFCHAETTLSRAVSRGLSLTGFPGKRRFTAQSLRRAAESNGVAITREELLPGAIPIGYLEGTLR